MTGVGTTDGQVPHVSLVLPCLDEVGSVGLVVRQALEAFHSAGIHGEVVVADNGSTDGSQAAAAAAGARVVDQPIRGYGAAIQAGIAASRGDIVVMADADATYPLERMPDLVGPVAAGVADMVIGARWTGATLQTMPFLHRFVGTPVLTWLVRRAGGPAGLTDSQSGMRAFRREAMIDLGLRSTGMEYASEMLIVAGRAGWRIQEIATGYRERIGESKLDTFSDGWRHLKAIVQLAPDLVATYPGMAGMAVGVALVTVSFAPGDVIRTGSLVWLAALLGPMLLLLGAQAAVVGLVLQARSPVGRPRRRGPDPVALVRQCLAGGAWLIGIGLSIMAALLVGWLLDLGLPRTGLQLGSVAAAMIAIGVSLAGIVGLAAISDAGHRRWSPDRSE